MRIPSPRPATVSTTASGRRPSVAHHGQRRGRLKDSCWSAPNPSNRRAVSNSADTTQSLTDCKAAAPVSSVLGGPRGGRDARQCTREHPPHSRAGAAPSPRVAAPDRTRSGQISATFARVSQSQPAPAPRPRCLLERLQIERTRSHLHLQAVGQRRQLRRPATNGGRGS